MKVVIDTNVLLVSTVPGSKSSVILNALVDGQLEICITEEIMLEYEEIFNRIGGYLAKEFLSESLLSLPKINFVDVYYKWYLIDSDPDDNKFVDCAIAANSDYIITEDKHFNVLKTIAFPKVETINSSDFISQVLKK
jgi:putative PIN family toxin of toxin-antitoxin system